MVFRLHTFILFRFLYRPRAGRRHLHHHQPALLLLLLLSAGIFFLAHLCPSTCVGNLYRNFPAFCFHLWTGAGILLLSNTLFIARAGHCLLHGSTYLLQSGLHARLCNRHLHRPTALLLYLSFYRFAMLFAAFVALHLMLHLAASLSNHSTLPCRLGLGARIGLLSSNLPRAGRLYRVWHSPADLLFCLYWAVICLLYRHHFSAVGLRHHRDGFTYIRPC